MYSIIGFLITIGILVTIHELGHYLVARWCGVKVLRFSFGFGPVIWSRRRGPDQTEWALSAVPLGGYVRMLDERDGEPIEESDLPRAFNRKSVWRRFAIVAAGPLANLLLAAVLLSAMYMIGVPGQQPVLSLPPTGTPAATAGLRLYDRIVAVDGQPIQIWQDVDWKLLRADKGATVMLTVERDQQRVQVPLTLPVVGGEDKEVDGMLPLLGLQAYAGVPQIAQVVAGSPAAQAGLQEGDRVQSVDGERVFSPSALTRRIAAAGDRPVALEILDSRNPVPRTVKVTPRQETDKDGKPVTRIGIVIAADQNEIKRLAVTAQYGVFDAIDLGVTRTVDMTLLSFKTIGRMLIGSASLKNLSGPITIATVAGQTVQAGLPQFMTYLAVISIGLGVLNLLPVPLLDGGHLLYYSAEIVRGRPLSERVTEIGQRIGLAFIITLIALALLNDFSRLF